MKDLNLIEILPIGSYVYSTLNGMVKVVEINKEGFIICKDKRANYIRFYSNGKWAPDGECILFPSDKNKDWTPIISGNFLEDKAIIDGIFINASDLYDLKEQIDYENVMMYDKGVEERPKPNLEKSKDISDLRMTEFKPFDKVLVKEDDLDAKWKVDFYSHIEKDSKYGELVSPKHRCVGGTYYWCVPYNKETEFLLNTNYIF